MVEDSWWTNGFCSIFATALQQRFGGEIWAIANHSKVCPEDDYLEHCYCIINGVAYDADGPHSIEEASDTSQYTVPEMDAKLDASIVWKQVNHDWFNHNHEDYNLSYIPDANNFIDRHPKRFNLTVPGRTPCKDLI